MIDRSALCRSDFWSQSGVGQPNGTEVARNSRLTFKLKRCFSICAVPDPPNMVDTCAVYRMSQKPSFEAEVYAVKEIEATLGLWKGREGGDGRRCVSKRMVCVWYNGVAEATW